MTYKIDVPVRRFQALLGTGYPRLANTIPDFEKIRYINYIVKPMFDNNIEYGRNDFGTSIHEQIKTVGHRGPSAYNRLAEFEEWLESVPRLGRFSPPSWWNSMAFNSPKPPIYCIDAIDAIDLYKFIKDKKVSHRKFQIFSKYGNDKSIAFHSKEMATMFKLHFAEKLI
jgi:hypothetical protein